MTKDSDLRRRAMAAVSALPEPGLEEVVIFLDYLGFKFGLRSRKNPPYTPVPLGGLWKGVTIRDEDLEEVRHDMWKEFGERDS